MNQLAVNLMCVLLRNGMELWMEEEKAKTLLAIITAPSYSSGGHRFVRLEDQVFNTADLVGVFTPAAMEEYVRRRNGEWKCKYNEWHIKGSACQCAEAARYQSPSVEAPPITDEQRAQGRTVVEKIRNDLSEKLDQSGGQGHQGVAQDEGGVGEVKSS